MGELKCSLQIFGRYCITLLNLFLGSSFYGSTDRGAFGDALAEMDDSIGKILNYLDESGLRDQTMVFFTSDNG